MKLTIHTPSTDVTYFVAWIEINTPMGNYIIQEGHAPTILTLSPFKPLIFRLKTGKQETVTVYHGTIEIKRESATIIMTVKE